jgi:hypothetical protein
LQQQQALECTRRTRKRARKQSALGSLSIVASLYTPALLLESRLDLCSVSVIIPSAQEVEKEKKKLQLRRKNGAGLHRYYCCSSSRPADDL